MEAVADDQQGEKAHHEGQRRLQDGRLGVTVDYHLHSSDNHDERHQRQLGPEGKAEAVGEEENNRGDRQRLCGYPADRMFFRSPLRRIEHGDEGERSDQIGIALLLQSLMRISYAVICLKKNKATKLDESHNKKQYRCQNTKK